MSAINQISEIIEKEVKSAVDKKITQYCEFISKRYGISLVVLLQDLEKIESEDGDFIPSPREEKVKSGQCLGIKETDHKRCTFIGKYGGYCKRHISQKKSEPPKVFKSNLISELQHTHSVLECVFKPGCPACEKSKRIPSKENLLIDL